MANTSQELYSAVIVDTPLGGGEYLYNRNNILIKEIEILITKLEILLKK